MDFMMDGEFVAFKNLILMAAKGFLNYSLINRVKIQGNIWKGDDIAAGWRRTWEGLKVKAGKAQEGGKMQ